VRQVVHRPEVSDAHHVAARVALWTVPYVVLWGVAALLLWRTAPSSTCTGLCGLAHGWEWYTLVNATLALTAFLGAIELATYALREHRSARD
jgi:hypothetical protein